MTTAFEAGQQVWSPKYGFAGKVLTADCEGSRQVHAPNATYTVEWDDGTVESMVYPSELQPVS